MGLKTEPRSSVATSNESELVCRAPTNPEPKAGFPASSNSVASFQSQNSSSNTLELVCSESSSIPSIPAHALRTQVELCRRAADLPLVGQLGAEHHWLKTPNKEVGMGQQPGQIPGHGEAPPVGLATKWIDHSKETQKECEVVAEVDVACVERETELGKDTGTWIPLLNDCHTKTQEVLDRCSTKPAGPDMSSVRRQGGGSTR